MSAPAVIDSVEFAQARRRVGGSLPVAGCARLGDLLADSAGNLDFVVEGGSDNRGRLQLALRVNGLLHLQCQRCLMSMDYPLAIASTLILLAAGVEANECDDDPEAPDSIEASRELKINDLIEDEILLSLPLHPRHAEGICQRVGTTDETEQTPQGKLAGLAALRNLGN